MNDSVLRTSGLMKSFDREAVLRGVDFDLPRGSVVGLLGRNGSGKTTLIKCVLGLLRIDEGDATIFGDDAWHLSAETKARLGYVPQAVQVPPWMRVRHAVNYHAAFYSRWNHELSDRLIEQWDLDPKQKVGVLSEGQLQRLAIVLALGHQPELLILDEPAASLDPTARRQFLQTVLEVAGGGERTVLFSTHITSDLERVADRVALLRGGLIDFFDELDVLKDSVKRLHVAAARDLPATLGVASTLREQVEGREATVSVRAFDGSMVERLEREHGANVAVEDLNLEDIFLEMDDG